MEKVGELTITESNEIRQQNMLIRRWEEEITLMQQTLASLVSLRNAMTRQVLDSRDLKGSFRVDFDTGEIFAEEMVPKLAAVPPVELPMNGKEPD